MFQIMRALAAGAAFLVLAGCVTGPAPYGPKTAKSSTGYTDKQLAANRYRVTFTGNSMTSREMVEDDLLRRAAEVTLKAGYDYFVFDTRSTKAKTTYMSNFTGWPGWGGYGWYWHSWDWGPWGPPYRPYEMEAMSQPITRYHAYAEIVLLTADQAKAEPRSLAARDVLAHLQPQKPDKPGS